VTDNRLPAWSCDAMLDVVQKKIKNLRAAPSRDRKNEELRQLLEDIGQAWSFHGSAFPQRLNVTRGGQAKAVEPWDLLETLLKDRGRTAFAMSHAVRREERGVDGLGETRWTKLHQSEFARLAMEFVAGLAVSEVATYRKLPLRILVVDNREPEHLADYDELLHPDWGLRFWKKAKWFKVKGGIKEFRDALRSGNSPHQRIREYDDRTNKEKPEPPAFWPDFDLILQDQFLDEEELHGDDEEKLHGDKLAELYYDRMPQALVFLTTGMDVQSLLSLGSARFVDRVIPKHHLAALPWYYYLAFTDVMGSMLWEPWMRSSNSKKLHFLARRESVRQLVGSIRRWKREPLKVLLLVSPVTDNVALGFSPRRHPRDSRVISGKLEFVVKRRQRFGEQRRRGLVMAAQQSRQAKGGELGAGHVVTRGHSVARRCHEPKLAPQPPEREGIRVLKEQLLANAAVNVPNSWRVNSEIVAAVTDVMEPHPQGDQDALRSSNVVHADRKTLVILPRAKNLVCQPP